MMLSDNNFRKNIFLTLMFMLLLGEGSLAWGTIRARDVLSQKNKNEPARVRIRVDFRPYEKVMVQDQSGLRRPIYKPIGSKVFTLRARIDHENHFYFENWHIETTPQSFQRDTQAITMRLSLYKVFGKSERLEQFVGSVQVVGHLVEVGPGLFNLVGHSQAQLNNARQEPIVWLKAGFSEQDMLTSQGHHASPTSEIAKKSLRANQNQPSN